jgi:hypothetical protein
VSNAIISRSRDPNGRWGDRRSVQSSLDHPGLGIMNRSAQSLRSRNSAISIELSREVDPMRMRLGWILVTTMAWMWIAPSAAADEAYYSIVFGSESTPKRLQFTHTWVTYVKVVGDPSDPAKLQITYHTISWLPATLKVRVLSLHPEPGVNLDLFATLDYVLSNGESVDCWAPMRITKYLYERSLFQYGRLMRGEALYQAADPPNDDVYDCIHANSALDPIFGQGHYPLIRVGKPASAYIVKQIGKRGLLFDPAEDTRWLISRLGIDRYPVRVIWPEIRYSQCPI